MSLSLVPEYGSSSSESESENEVTKRNPIQSNRSRNEQSSKASLGSALRSILPPPKASTQSRTVKIVVDLSKSKSTKAAAASSATANATEAEASKQKPNTGGQSISRSSKSSGGMFSDLSQFLPAPKNAAHAKASRSVSKAAEDEDEESGVKDSLSLSAASPMAMTSKPQITLVPHSISKKQRSKIPATLAESVSAKSIKLTGNSPKSTADICDNANAADIAEASNEAGDIDDQKSESTTATKKVHIIDQPFFTINASDQMSGDNPMAKVALAIDNDDGYDDQYQSESNNNNNNQPSTADAGPELHYDPTSGYYYDYVSGTYYYYDPKSQTYIDAKDLLESSSQNRVADVDPSDSDILNLIGRRGVRRGELEAVLNAPVKHVSQSAQLENSGYSDAKAAAEFAAKQWSENKRNKTQTLIDADTIDKKKRQKHNIMYLALQAQEQEETLKETFANRKRSKKEARSKYGY